MNNDVINTPTSEHNEVAPCGSLISTAKGEIDPAHTKGHFFASLEEMAEVPFAITNPDSLCAMLNVQASAQGLLGCNLRLLDAVTTIGIPKTPIPEFSSAYTARGHITDIHIDSVYEATIVTTLFGRKLLLQWPPSDFNLRTLSTLHWKSNAWRLHTLYPQLQDIKITLCDHGTAEHLPPGALHAVIALDNSAMMAYGLAHPSMLPEVQRIANWELSHAADLRLRGDPEGGITSILASHNNDISIWVQLMNKALMRPYKDQIVHRPGHHPRLLLRPHASHRPPRDLSPPRSGLSSARRSSSLNRGVMS
ncbi:hypothetical protein A4X09_0g7506 [Tilletia walkeri]|uniref:Uncharacterized protein n=1 Tax=Tilletia walkeri TaxID=117179 RepID=A0A8X7T212_9BASI|nr:hypothetical protein A4X09_0g7506 [Tilletia walkeri]